MKTVFYPKLAFSGIKKNRRLYVPYILSCIGMVALFCILSSLSKCKALLKMPGYTGNSVQSILGFGAIVIGIFALIFLFYTNSFLLKRRTKEFGLYNILGMNKANIGKLIAFETLIIYAISLLSGLILGLVLYKFCELGLLNVLKLEVDYSFNFSLVSLWQTFLTFTLIFLLLFLNSLRRVHKTNPLEMLHSENLGEKPPKSNIPMVILGVLLLGGAYCISVIIKTPLSALKWFFLAVIMVIVATYLLMTAGSVTLCKILQRNKKYYYRKNHFVSVSSLSFRMKRNGAGLATICILGTMVLVTLSTSLSLFIGVEDSIRAVYPRDVYTKISVEKPVGISKENTEKYLKRQQNSINKHNVKIKDSFEYRSFQLSGMLKADGKIACSKNYSDEAIDIFFIPVSDYNRIMNKNVELSDKEALIYCQRLKFKHNKININDKISYKTNAVSEFFDSKDILPKSSKSTMYLVVNNFDEVSGLMMKNKNFATNLSWQYGFDIKGDKSASTAITDEFTKSLADDNHSEEDGSMFFTCSGIEESRADFYGAYGGLLFIGVILSFAFMLATVLIVYYKQISEGYEDSSRFTIMQKIGMSKKDIRSSINSQMLTVFFAPPVFAGIHLGFAFPFLWKLLQLFNLYNLKLIITVVLSAFLAFVLLYIIIYRITSNSYFSIVSTKEND